MKRGCDKHMLKTKAFLLFAALALAGCGGPESRRDETAELPPPDNAVAVVDQTVIYNAAVQREALAQGLVQEGERLSPDNPEYDRLVDELVDQRLLALEARRRGLQNSPEARRRIAAAEERILGNILLETEIAVEVTEEAARRLYSEQTGLARPGEQIRARHILVDSREAADAIVALFDDGRDFAELAVQYSQDVATRIQGGDLGYFSRDGVLPEIASVAFAAQEGELAGPVETEAGWHVLLIVDRRSPDGPSFEDLRPSIVRFLTFETISRLVDSLREDARIELIEPEADEETDAPAIALEEADDTSGDRPEDNEN